MEKEKYIQYNKLKNVFNDCCKGLEKTKKEFDAAAKVCENNVVNYYKMKSLSLNSQINMSSKSEEKVKDSIANTKKFRGQIL